MRGTIITIAALLVGIYWGANNLLAQQAATKPAPAGVSISKILEEQQKKTKTTDSQVSMSKLVWLGAHNSPMNKGDKWRYYQQTGTLKQQWAAGARAFKVPIHWFNPGLTITGKIVGEAEKVVGEVKKEVKKVAKEVASGAKKVASAVEGLFKKSKKKSKTVKKSSPSRTSRTSSSSRQSIPSLCHEPDGSSNCKLTLWTRKDNADPRPAVNFFRELKQLLAANPNEIVILLPESFLHKRSEANGAVGKNALIALQQVIKGSGLGGLVYNLDKKYRNEDWPSREELLKQGKRVIILVDGPSPYNDVSFYKETQFDLNKSNNCEMRRGGRIGKNFFLMNHFREISLISGSTLHKAFQVGAKVGSPISGLVAKQWPSLAKNLKKASFTNYKSLNSKANLKRRYCMCKKQEGIAPNILLLDFVEQGDGAAFANEVNTKVLAGQDPCA